MGAIAPKSDGSDACPGSLHAEARRSLLQPITREGWDYRNAPVVPAGVDTVLFKPRDRTRARAALGWKQDRMHVLLPGARTNPVKRSDLFDQVVGLVRRIVHDVRGVSLEGYSREDVANVMNAADVVLLTSDSEGSPVTVKEALACGTPVVSVPVGDVATVLGGLPGCAIVPREPSLLADAVLASRTVRDPSLRQRALEFSYERMADQILKIYEGARLGLLVGSLSEAA